MADRPAHRRRSALRERAGRPAPGTRPEVTDGPDTEAGAGATDPEAAGSSPPPLATAPLPGPPAAPTLPPDVRTGVRTLTLRVNRVANGVLYGTLVLVVLVFLFGAYRLAASGPLSGIVIMAVAVLLAVWPVRKLGPGRLLTLEVTPDHARLVGSFQAPVDVERTAALRAVLWVTRGYAGGEPRLRGLYLVEGEEVVASARPATFTTERVQRFFGRVAIPVELVDAQQAPFPVAR